MPVIVYKHGEYRDIRADLKERLRTSVADRDAALARAQEKDAEVDVLTKMIDQEERRFNGGAAQAKEKPQKPLADFIVEKLQTKNLTKEELRIFAEHAGYFSGGESPARSIHATVINLVRRGKITDIGGGYYE